LGAQMPLTFAHVTQAESSDMEGLLALYEVSIPARERKPFAAIRQMAASPHHRVEVACEAQRVVGFSLLACSPRLGLLEYMAVDPRRRGAGLGASLYGRAKAATLGRPMLIEVEADVGIPPDLDVRRRRIEFYRRLGCRRLVGFDYLLPLAGEGPPPAMVLLVDKQGDEVLPASLVDAWLNDIFCLGYQLPHDDPVLQSMRCVLPQAVCLE
jgi:GNAT superfamily N-acetyltransferase